MLYLICPEEEFPNEYDTLQEILGEMKMRTYTIQDLVQRNISWLKSTMEILTAMGLNYQNFYRITSLKKASNDIIFSIVALAMVTYPQMGYTKQNKSVQEILEMIQDLRIAGTRAVTEAVNGDTRSLQKNLTHLQTLQQMIDATYKEIEANETEWRLFQTRMKDAVTSSMLSRAQGEPRILDHKAPWQKFSLKQFLKLDNTFINDLQRTLIKAGSKRIHKVLKKHFRTIYETFRYYASVAGFDHSINHMEYKMFLTDAKITTESATRIFEKVDTSKLVNRNMMRLLARRSKFDDKRSVFRKASKTAGSRSSFVHMDGAKRRSTFVSSNLPIKATVTQSVREGRVMDLLKNLPNELNAGEFVSCVILLAFAQYPTALPHEAIHRLVQRNLKLNLGADAPVFKDWMEDTMAGFMQIHNKELGKVFLYYSEADNEENMSFSEFTDMLSILEIRLDQSILNRIFWRVQRGDSFEETHFRGNADCLNTMDFEEFKEAISVVAIYWNPDPYVPQDIRCKDFITNFIMDKWKETMETEKKLRENEKEKVEAEEQKPGNTSSPQLIR